MKLMKVSKRFLISAALLVIFIVVYRFIIMEYIIVSMMLTIGIAGVYYAL